MIKKRFVTTLIFLVLTAVFVAACKTSGEHIHAFGDWFTVRAATCTEDGLEARTCSCGEREERPQASTGHSYGGWQTDAYGHRRVCTVCGDVSEEGEHIIGSDNACTVCSYTLVFTDTLTYTEILKEDGTVAGYAVSGLEEGADVTDIVVPYYHGGLPVISIAEQAFYQNAAITGVSAPSVTTVGGYAFAGCTSLAGVGLPAVETVDKYAFYGSALKNIVLPESTREIGQGAFYECTGLETAEILGAESIGKYAFYGCTSLSSVVFGEKTDVAFESKSYVFMGCTALSAVTVNSGNLAFEGYTFYSCTQASVDVVFGDGVTVIGENALGASSASGKAYRSVTIGKNVTQIGDGAFKACVSLVSVELPDGLKSIGQTAFMSCSALEEIIIPESVESIDLGAFGGCSSLKRVIYGGTAGEWASIGFGLNTVSNPLNGGAVLYVGGAPQTELIIDGTERVNPYAFYGGTYSSVVLGESVKSVGDYSFGLSSSAANANSLERLVILGKTLTATSFSFNNTFSADGTKVFYNGTAEEMDGNVKTGNGSRFCYGYSELKHYFYSQSSPESEGNYWHKDDDGNILIWE